MKLLLYCTKEKNKYDRLVRDEHYGETFYLYGAITENFESLNGKIVAECDFDVEELTYAPNPSAFERANFSPKEWGYDYQEKYGGLSNEELLKHSCLTNEELSDYLNTPTNDKKVFCKDTFGYAIHIKNLHIFDTPKELSDYYKFDGIYNNINNWKTIDKAPQNMMYAYDLISELGFSGTYNMHLKKNILISIQPQWMCLILNRIKDVEVRKVVLKEMLENE